MTDVFISYSSEDRERVRPIHDALVEEGFDVFWDQDVPPGSDWDECIRQHLDAARCAIVFWSGYSVKSKNVKHEASIAESAGKLIPVLLDPIEVSQFPMGHYTTQALLWPANGDASATLRRLTEEVEAKAMRRWMRRKMAELEGRVASLTKAREQNEDRENIQHRRISELETELEQGRRERGRLQTALISATEKLSEVQAALTASQEDLSRFKLNAQTAQQRVVQLETELRNEKSGEPTAAAADVGPAKNEVAVIEAQVHYAGRALAICLLICLASIAVFFLADTKYNEEFYTYAMREHWEKIKIAATIGAGVMAFMAFIFFLALIVHGKRLRSIKKAANESVSF
jgi:hypothetical protein